MPHKKKRFRLTKGSKAASKSLSPRRTKAIADRAGSTIRDHPFQTKEAKERERRNHAKELQELRAEARKRAKRKGK